MSCFACLTSSLLLLDSPFLLRALPPCRKDTVLPPAIARRSCRLIVRNLPFDAMPADIVAAFGGYGPILEINIPAKAPAEGAPADRKPLSYVCVDALAHVSCC